MYLVCNERFVLKSKDSFSILPHRPRVCCHMKQHTKSHDTLHNSTDYHLTNFLVQRSHGYYVTQHNKSHDYQHTYRAQSAICRRSFLQELGPAVERQGGRGRFRSMVLDILITKFWYTTLPTDLLCNHKMVCTQVFNK